MCFFFYKGSQCCSSRSSNFYLAAVFWLWAGRYRPPLPKEQENTVCSDLRSVPLHLARKPVSSLLRSCAISTTDDTLMDAMEDQQESLASICNVQPTNVSPVPWFDKLKERVTSEKCIIICRLDVCVSFCPISSTPLPLPKSPSAGGLLVLL